VGGIGRGLGGGGVEKSRWEGSKMGDRKGTSLFLKSIGEGQAGKKRGRGALCAHGALRGAAKGKLPRSVNKDEEKRGGNKRKQSEIDPHWKGERGTVFTRLMSFCEAPRGGGISFKYGCRVS